MNIRYLFLKRKYFIMDSSNNPVELKHIIANCTIIKKITVSVVQFLMNLADLLSVCDSLRCDCSCP